MRNKEISDKMLKNKESQYMKQYTNIFYWVAMGSLIIWFSYTKGWILANFESIDAKQAYTLINNDENVTLLDVRTAQEFKVSHIRNSTLIPLQILKENLNKLTTDKNKKILVYCQTGRRSVNASRILKNNGFTPINIKDGMIAMKYMGFEVLSTPHTIK